MEQRIGIERMEEAINLFGSFDENIRLLESEFQVTVVNRGGELVISGEPENVMLAEKAVQALLTLSAKGESISEQHVRYVVGLCRSGQSERIGELTQDVICITSKGRPVKPKTIGQKQYVDAIMQDTVTIGVGPAGTGKTYLAVAAAVAAFNAILPGTIGGTIIQISLLFFALSTILGWSQYGNRAISYLLGKKAVLPYYIVFLLFVFWGCMMVGDAAGSAAVSNLSSVVWNVADVMNALMAIPNCIAVLGLSAIIARETKHYVYDNNLEEVDKTEIPQYHEK